MHKTKIERTDWPLVSIGIPCYNAMKFLPISLPSIMELDYPNLEIILIDDASTDGSADYVEKNFPQIKVYRNQKNQGFAKGVNKAFWLTKGKYYFMVNQDTVYQSDYLKICINSLETDHKIGAICGKVYKYDFDAKKPTTIIDTIGQVAYRDRRVADEGQGIEESEHAKKSHQQDWLNQPGEVFGVSGQNPIYRRTALESISIPLPSRDNPEIFDEDFFMYKEDVDVAWRLRLFGWKAWYEPSAISWHGRGTSAVKRTSNREILANRGLLSKFQKYHSIKNRYLMMLKNEFTSEYLKNLPWIWWSDFLYFGYNLIFDTKNLKAYFDAIKLSPRIWKKRQWIKSHRQAKPADLAKWFKGEFRPKNL